VEFHKEMCGCSPPTLLNEIKRNSELCVTVGHCNSQAGGRG